MFTILGNKPVELIKGTGYFVEEVIHFIRNEFAQNISDVLARRFRILFLDLDLAEKLIKPVSKILSSELKWTESKTKVQEKISLDLIQNLRKTYHEPSSK